MKPSFLYVIIAGSNIGQREKNLDMGKASLEKNGDILETSGVYATPPYGMKNQPDFLNQGFLYRTQLPPRELLGRLREIEIQCGRVPSSKNSPRVLDLDIAWWENNTFSHAELTIPHVRNRARFWVVDIFSELEQKIRSLPALAEILHRCRIKNLDDPGDFYYFTDALTKIPYQRLKKMPIHNITDFIRKKRAGEKIAMLTVYDYSMARLMAKTSIDTVLVGDSLGNVFQGHANTLSVTVDDIIYHTRAVRRALPDIFLVADMPFLSFQVSHEEAVRNAGRILKESGADAVKLEGAGPFVETIRRLTAASIPVMGHLGLTPQSVLQLGGYKVQGREKAAQELMIQDARAIQDAGAFALVAEVIPSDLGTKLSQAVEIPVIGIGAGPGTDGQVLVVNDMLGMDPEFSPKMVRHYADLGNNILQAMERYCLEVRESRFPDERESYE